MNRGFLFSAATLFAVVRLYAAVWNPPYVRTDGSDDRLPRERGPGLIRDIIYEKPDALPVIFGGWSKAENVNCADYCLYADIWYADGTAKWGVRANFRQGTHGWEKSDMVFVPRKPVRRIRINSLCRKGSGKASFRDCFMFRRKGAGELYAVDSRPLWPYGEESLMTAERLDGMKTVSVRMTVPGSGGNRRSSPVEPGKAEVWTADSMVRVSPLTFPDVPFAGKSVDLELAKGEAESAQILVTAADDLEWTCGTLEPGVLRDAGGTEFKGEVKWERQAYLARSRGYVPHPHGMDPSETWFPDPLLPAAPFRVRKGSTQGLWLTFTAARDAKPGIYRGSVRVAESGKTAAEVPVVLRVRDFALPETFGLETAFSLMDGFLRARYPRSWREMKRKAIDLMLDHRLNPDDITRTSPPEMEDLEHARRRGMNRFNILNVVPAPRKNSTAKWTLVAKPDAIFSDSFYREFTSRLRPYVEELRRRDLMRFAYVYGFDERQSEYYEGIEKFWKRLKTDFPDLPLMTTAKQYADMQMGKTNLPSLVSCDWYCPCTYRWTESINRKLRAKGMKIWWYTCCGPRYPYANMASYEYPLIEGRVLLGVMTWHYASDGFLFWHVNNWNESRQKTLGTGDTYCPEWDTYSHLEMPGDGLFLYPAEKTVLPSIRLAQVRDGVEDHEWLSIAARKHGRDAVDALVKGLVPSLTRFSRDPAELRRARTAVGDLAAGRR